MKEELIQRIKIKFSDKNVKATIKDLEKFGVGGIYDGRSFSGDSGIHVKQHFHGYQHINLRFNCRLFHINFSEKEGGTYPDRRCDCGEAD